MSTANRAETEIQIPEQVAREEALPNIVDQPTSATTEIEVKETQEGEAKTEEVKAASPSRVHLYRLVITGLGMVGQEKEWNKICSDAQALSQVGFPQVMIEWVNGPIKEGLFTGKQWKAPNPRADRRAMLKEAGIQLATELGFKMTAEEEKPAEEVKEPEEGVREEAVGV